MDVLSPFFHVLLRSLVVLFPLTVGWLSLRRLALSKSGNAWYYAIVFLFSTITTAGILPWTLGLNSLNWMLILLALASPAVWIGITHLCDGARHNRYGRDVIAETARSIPRLAPLLLENPIVPESPAPMFRHREVKSPPATARKISQKTRTILSLARDIRGNVSSDQRRPRLLPAPDTRDLPFLPRKSNA